MLEEACRQAQDWRDGPFRADRTTIIMLTANNDAADKIEAFSAGADDYMLKPFAPRDLVARVHAANRRRQDLPEPLIEEATPKLGATDGRSAAPRRATADTCAGAKVPTAGERPE